MTTMIDRKQYFEKLIDILNATYPTIDYRKMNRRALNPNVATEMSRYVTEKYGFYYSDHIKELLDENHKLLESCLKELGML